MVASENLILRKFWIHLAIDDIFRVFDSGYFSSEDLEKLMRFITKLRTILALGIILLLSSIQQGLGCNSSRDLSESRSSCGFAGQHGTQFEEPLQRVRVR